MKTEARILKNTFLMTAQPLILNVISIFAVAYIARKLGLIDFGTMNLAVLFSTFFYPLGVLGLKSVAIRDISAIRGKPDLVRDYVGKNLPLRACIILIAMALLMVSAFGMKYPERLTLAILLAGIVLAFQLIMEATCDVFYGYEKMEYAALTSLVSGLTLTALSVLVLFLGYGLFEVIGAYAVGQFIGWVVSILLLIRLLSTIRPGVDFVFWKERIRQGLPFISMSLMWAAITRMDTLFLSKMTSEENLGYYTTAMLLVTKINIIPEAIGAAIFPAVSNLYSQKETSEVIALYKKFITFSLLLALPICIETCFFSSEIIGLIFGSQYSQASFVLRFAIWALLLRCVMFIQFAILTATHNEIKTTKAYLLALLSSVILNGTFTYFHGVSGALTSFLTTQLILFVAFSWFVAGTLNLHPDWKKILMLLVLNILLVGMLHASCSLPFLIAVGISIPLYLVGLILLRIVTISEIHAFIKIPRSA